MTAQEYIQNKLDKLKTPEIRTGVDASDLGRAILSKVLSKKFRKNKADDIVMDLSKKAIRHAIENKKPVKFGVLFGGNKLWRFEEAPEVDWAELFCLIYLSRYMKTIASVYEYGAELEFYSQDVSVERLNNVSKEDTEKYHKSFQNLLNWFKQYVPDGVSISYKRQLDEYSSQNEYDKEIEEAKEAYLRKNNEKLPVLTEAQKLATELNVKLRPKQDKDPRWREKVEWEHQAIFMTKTLKPYLTDETIIPICPTPFEGCIATGSTKYSIAKFWAGVGVLQKTDDNYKDLVLTPKQLDVAAFTWQDMDWGPEGKNFRKIRILS